MFGTQILSNGQIGFWFSIPFSKRFCSKRPKKMWRSQPQLFCQPVSHNLGPPTLLGALFGCDGWISWISSWASPVSWREIHISSCSGRRSQFCKVTTPPPLFLLTQLNTGITLNYGRYIPSLLSLGYFWYAFLSWFYEKDPLKNTWLLAQAGGLWNKKRVETEWVTLTPWSL